MAKQTAPSTQEHLPIAGIIDGAVLMSDGSLRAIIKVDPINFDLKSEQEQNAIIYAYQAFLNSLDFPIQIVVQSKKLDLEQYLLRMQASQKNVTNDLLRIQIEDYTGFVRRLISVANIMSKRFYIVVSYSTVSRASSAAQFTSIFHRQPTGALMDEEEFKRNRTEVHNRAASVAGGIGRLGVKSTLLDTQQLIELFYGIYNPDVVAEERLTDVDNMNTNVVSSPSVNQENLEQTATPVPTPMAMPVMPTPTPQSFIPPLPTPAPATTSGTPVTPAAPPPAAPTYGVPVPPLQPPVATTPQTSALPTFNPALSAASTAEGSSSSSSLLDEPLSEVDTPKTTPPPAPATSPSLQEQVPTPPILNLENLFEDEPPAN